MNEHLYTYIDPPNEKHLDRIVDVLRHDGVIAVQAGTSWALACDPVSKKAERRIRALKPEHPKDRPFALMCSDIAMATTMIHVDGSAYRLLKRIWPGSFTVLLKANSELPRILKTKRKVVGVRIPDDALALAIVEHFGGPLLVTTVPKRGDGEPFTMGFEVHEVHGHALDLVVDLGEPLSGEVTTVIDLSDGELEVIREAAGDLALL